MFNISMMSGCIMEFPLHRKIQHQLHLRIKKKISNSKMSTNSAQRGITKEKTHKKMLRQTLPVLVNETTTETGTGCVSLRVFVIVLYCTYQT